MQEAIKNTLIKHQEASAFVETLEEQNISVITRVEKKNQIVGISFGLDGRKFKGSHLGTIFTWEGLKKQGLNYEHERDYGRLEEASQRAREGKSGAGNKQESPSKGKQKLNQEIGSDRDFSDRSKIDDRQIRKESGDKKDGIDSREEFISVQKLLR